MANKVFSLRYECLLTREVKDAAIPADSFEEACEKLPAFRWARPVPKVNTGKKVVKDFQSRIQE